ncbi:MAG: hypothetical protein PHH26_04985 [Candidatus Thermoplasmatota archaeon]|nr:hypothetical protein [Candidatus Thermoplasmatota archaeon]
MIKTKKAKGAKAKQKKTLKKASKKATKKVSKKVLCKVRSAEDKEKKGSCKKCEFWDHRIESGMDEHTGFCTIKRKMVCSDYWCKDFSEIKSAEEISEMLGDEEEEYGDMIDFEE